MIRHCNARKNYFTLLKKIRIFLDFLMEKEIFLENIKSKRIS